MSTTEPKAATCFWVHSLSLRGRTATVRPHHSSPEFILQDVVSMQNGNSDETQVQYRPTGEEAWVGVRVYRGSLVHIIGPSA